MERKQMGCAGPPGVGCWRRTAPMAMLDALVYTTKSKVRSGKARQGADVIAVLMDVNAVVHVVFQCFSRSYFSWRVRSVRGAVSCVKFAMKGR
jgi:hypothetical protein